MARWLIALLATLAAGCSNDGDATVAVGTLERDRIEITAEAWEVVTAVEVTEGDAVTEGQVLARQDARRTELRLAQLEAAVGQADRRLAELLRGPRREEIDEARARLRGADGQLETDLREYARVTDLVAKALLSESELDAARARRDTSRAARDEAYARLEALLEGTTVEELDQAKAALAEAEALADDARLTLERLVLRATRDGVVDSLPVEAGDRPDAGQVIAVLLADGAPYARVYVPAAVRAKVTPGTPATVTVDGVDGVFRGRVRTVAAEAAFTPYFALTERDRGRLSYLAEVTLDEAEAGGLPTGLPVEVRFESDPSRAGSR